MNQEITITKNELTKLSIDFRTIAARLLKTRFNEGMSNLKRFINKIDSNPILNNFIKKNNHFNFEMERNLSNYANYPLGYKIPNDSKEEEISFLYQLLKYGLIIYSDNNDYGYWELSKPYYYSCKQVQEPVDKFNRSIVKPLVDYIETYLTHLQIDNGFYEQQIPLVKIEGNNYGNNLGDNRSEMNIDQKDCSIGVNVNHGKINTNTLAGTINNSSQINEIMELIDTLRQNINSIPSEYQDVANESRETLESEVKNPTKISKLKTSLLAIWSIGKDVAIVGNTVFAIAERFGITLPG